MMGVRIEARGEWAGGYLGTWAPAVCGTLNQTGTSDEDASTFATRDEAQEAFENVIAPALYEDNREYQPRFRLVDTETGDTEAR